MDQYVQSLLREKKHNQARNTQRQRHLYGAQRDIEQTNPLLEPEVESPGLWSKTKTFIKENWILFLVVFLLFVASVIGIIVYFTVFVDRKRETNTNTKGSKEKFKATNNLNDEYEYVNSYINSVLGNSDDMTVIDENATTV